jgi:signal transduction histidine kinase
VASRWALQLNRDGTPHAILEVNTDITAAKQAEEGLRLAHAELETRVRARTAELEASNRALADSQEQLRQSAEQILRISEREQTRIGQDLHDDLCQQLAGIEFLANVLRQQSQDGTTREQAREIAQLVRQAITNARNLARGLVPVELEAGGLIRALEGLALQTQTRFGVSCFFVCPSEVQIANQACAIHLFRIAQEAVTNSFWHGRPHRIEVRLILCSTDLQLVVQDDGLGIAEATQASKGMGLRIMQYRASALGGRLEIGPVSPRGTVVTCSVPRAILEIATHTML